MKKQEMLTELNEICRVLGRPGGDFTGLAEEIEEMREGGMAAEIHVVEHALSEAQERVKRLAARLLETEEEHEKAIAELDRQRLAHKADVDAAIELCEDSGHGRRGMLTAVEAVSMMIAVIKHELEQTRHAEKQRDQLRVAVDACVLIGQAVERD